MILLGELEYFICDSLVKWAAYAVRCCEKPAWNMCDFRKISGGTCEGCRVGFGVSMCVNGCVYMAV